MVGVSTVSSTTKSSSRGSMPVALNSMLSQLSFTTEVPHDHTVQKQQHHGFVWQYLFCFSMDDDDLFFDARQDLAVEVSDRSLDDCHTDTSTHSGIAELRGGAASGSGSSGGFGGAHDDGDYFQEMGFEYTHNGIYPSQQLLSKDCPYVEQRPPLPLSPPPQQRLPSVSKKLDPFERLVGPPPPKELPLRFLKAGKGDPVEGRRRYEATLDWRRENGMGTILLEAHPDFELIKQHYPHYYHLKGRKGEPVFYEQPPKTNLAAMKRGGVTLQGLLRHYAMVTEFQWQCIERDDMARSITILDLEGMRMMDFVGECVEYVRKCSEFTGQHYPERAGHVFVINTPGWFQMIWNVVKPMVDEVTLKKITILRDKKAILQALVEKIPIENIPPEYGGQSMPLGQSPQENMLRELILHNNALARGDYSCGGRANNPPCPYCSFAPIRSY